jgi:aerobic-type carbon monoxide dehydrogenase small subunit (CoxS/CutS family)
VRRLYRLIVDKQAVHSCVTPVKAVAGTQVLTSKAWANGSHPLHDAFLRRHAFQCGYCTPNDRRARAVARRPKPTRAEIVQHMDDNLSRCGSHAHPQAIEDAAGVAKEVRDETADFLKSSGRPGWSCSS